MCVYSGGRLVTEGKNSLLQQLLAVLPRLGITTWLPSVSQRWRTQRGSTDGLEHRPVRDEKRF